MSKNTLIWTLTVVALAIFLFFAWQNYWWPFSPNIKLTYESTGSSILLVGVVESVDLDNKTITVLGTLDSSVTGMAGTEQKLVLTYDNGTDFSEKKLVFPTRAELEARGYVFEDVEGGGQAARWNPEDFTTYGRGTAGSIVKEMHFTAQVDREKMGEGNFYVRNFSYHLIENR